MNLLKEKKSDKLLLWIGLFYILIFLILYPTNVIIADGWVYFRQAIAYSQGTALVNEIEPIAALNQPLPYGHYPIGNPFVLATLIYFFGKKSVFLLGFLSMLGSFFYLSKVLENFKLDKIFSLILFLYFPAVLLSRTLMSDVPSLLCITIFLYLFSLPNKNKLTYFKMGIAAVLPILFREPNLLLVFPFLFSMLFNEKIKNLVWVFLGGTLMMGLRLWGTYWAFGDPFFLKDPGVSFSLSFLLKNALFYAPFLLLVIPAGLWAVIWYRGMYQKEMQAAIIFFVGLFLIYGYNGSHFSGMKSIILGPRFLIPALPIFAIGVAKMCEKEFRWIRKILIPFSIISILGTQLIGWYYNVEQQNALFNLKNEDGKVHLIAELNSVPKIFIPNDSEYKTLYVYNQKTIEEIIQRDGFAYIVTAFRKDTEVAKVQTGKLNEKLKSNLNDFKLEDVASYQLPDGIVIQQYKCGMKD